MAMVAASNSIRVFSLIREIGGRSPADPSLHQTQGGLALGELPLIAPTRRRALKQRLNLPATSAFPGIP
jgi:hypothetical protein